MIFPAASFADGHDSSERAWRRHGAALGIAALCLILLFGNDSADLARIWWTSTTFGHCLFIGPVIAWLVWQRRRDLAQLTPGAWLPGLAIVAIGGFGWMLGAAASVSLARHLGLVIMLQGLVITLLGPRVARGLTFPLAYAFFLVPFGQSLETPLQTVTVAMTMKLLHLTGIPATVDGVLISIPNGYFEVAEACSGAKFVIAMIAYGMLVANVAYVAWPRRIAFMAMAVVVPVIANGLRAFGTIYAAHLTSVEAATGFDHIVYGWVFFGLVMAAVIAIGWHWFDRDPDAPWFDAERLKGTPVRHSEPWLAAALALTLAAVFPFWSSVVDAQASRLPDRIALPGVAGWRLVSADGGPVWSPHYPAADHVLIGRYADGAGDSVDLAIAVYASQHEGKELVGFGIGALRENDRWVRINGLADIEGGSAMRITTAGPVERVVVSWYRVGQIVTGSEARVKIETLRTRLLGGPQRAVAVHVSAQVQPGVDARTVIERFLRSVGPIERLADRSAGLTG